MHLTPKNYENFAGHCNAPQDTTGRLEKSSQVVLCPMVILVTNNSNPDDSSFERQPLTRLGVDRGVKCARKVIIT